MIDRAAIVRFLLARKQAICQRPAPDASPQNTSNGVGRQKKSPFTNVNGLCALGPAVNTPRAITPARLSIKPGNQTGQWDRAIEF
jgi:hypothetical protein